MTGHQINSLVGDLVAMAQAMERLPQVEHELELANGRIFTINESMDVIKADLEQSRSYAATLEQKVRDAEVAKDAAETMFLEADERTSRALDFVKAMFGSAGSLIQALEPPRAEPVVERAVWHGDLPKDEPKPEPIVSAVKPIAADPTLHSEPSSMIAGGETIGEASPPQGQSEADPIHGVSQETQEHPADTTFASNEKSATQSSWATPSPQPDTPPAPAPQPYAGKNYFEWPGYVDYNDWLEGGGTHDDYWQRRNEG